TERRRLRRNRTLRLPRQLRRHPAGLVGPAGPRLPRGRPRPLPTGRERLRRLLRQPQLTPELAHLVVVHTHHLDTSLLPPATPASGPTAATPAAGPRRQAGAPGEVSPPAAPPPRPCRTPPTL